MAVDRAVGAQVGVDLDLAVGVGIGTNGALSKAGAATAPASAMRADVGSGGLRRGGAVEGQSASSTAPEANEYQRTMRPP